LSQHSHPPLSSLFPYTTLFRSAILVDGERVTATAPRLSVATGMVLTGRVVGPDGRPWELTMHVDDAAYHTPDLAMLRMHPSAVRSEEHTSELQSRFDLVCRLLL